MSACGVHLGHAVERRLAELRELAREVLAAEDPPRQQRPVDVGHARPVAPKSTTNSLKWCCAANGMRTPGIAPTRSIAYRARAMIPSPTSAIPAGPITARYTPAVMAHSAAAVPVHSLAVSRCANEVRSNRTCRSRYSRRRGRWPCPYEPGRVLAETRFRRSSALAMTRRARRRTPCGCRASGRRRSRCRRRTRRRLHDAQRDGIDADHEQRAAAWARRRDLLALRCSMTAEVRSGSRSTARGDVLVGDLAVRRARGPAPRLRSIAT